MRKLLFISCIMVLLVCCKTLCISHKEKTKAKQSPIISYCRIFDSLKILPKYDYSLVKKKTVFISDEYEDSEQRVKDAEAKGLRGVVMGRVPDPYEMDSISYIREAYHEAHTLFRRQIKDSVLKVGGEITHESIEAIANQKIANEHCFPEDLWKK